MHLPKIKFLMLMRNGALAGLATRYDDAMKTLTIKHKGKLVAQGRLDRREGRAVIEAYLTRFLGDEIRGPVRLLAAPDGHRFMDLTGFVSLINLSSVEAIAEAAGKLSIRCAFAPTSISRRWRPGPRPSSSARPSRWAAQSSKPKMIDRCAATGVEPDTGARDMDIVDTLRKNFGHIDCGVYAKVLEGGDVKIGDMGRA